MAFDTFEVGKDKVAIERVFPDPDKLDLDIVLPQLADLLERKKSLAEEIAAIDVRRISAPRFAQEAGRRRRAGISLRGLRYSDAGKAH